MIIGDKVTTNFFGTLLEGTIISSFAKLNGKICCVIEDDRGLLFIADVQNVRVKSNEPQKYGGYKLCDWCHRILPSDGICVCQKPSSFKI